MHVGKAWYSAGVGCIVFVIIVALQIPRLESHPRLVSIPEGASLREIASILGEGKYIVSPFFLRVFVTLMGGGNDVKAGDYEFEKPQGTARIAWRLVHGDYDIEPVKVFIPEGTSVREMADILKEHLLSFNAHTFIALASSHEGFLFPDTYFVPPNASAETIIALLTKQFDEKISGLEEAITASGHTLNEIVTMASILEEEARTPEDRRIVAGILWNRMDIGMALQVDAPFVYLLGKGSADLTGDDLMLDSPYNTYTNQGLPPGPITNPGLDAIEAALEPTTTEYLFYLSDSDGVMHYAVTFEEHKRNKELYLR